MIYLIGSIVLTSWLTLSFKVVERLKIDAFQAIVFNYIACVITGSLVNGGFLHYGEIIHQSWFGWACLMGGVFIGLFNIIGLTTRKMGVAVASVANKLSLVIPFVFSVILYSEKVTWLKITGIVLALAAVVLTCFPKRNDKETIETNKRGGWLYILPAVLFIGSGLLDTMIKYVEQGFLNDTNKNEYLISAFSVAAAIGVIILLVKTITEKAKLSYKGVLAGLMIGIPNYFSIWCLVQVLRLYAGNSTAIIPINNMGIVLFSAVMAMIMFSERLSAINWVGIVLAVGAIALIAYG